MELAIGEGMYEHFRGSGMAIVKFDSELSIVFGSPMQTVGLGDAFLVEGLDPYMKKHGEEILQRMRPNSILVGSFVLEDCSFYIHFGGRIDMDFEKIYLKSFKIYDTLQETFRGNTAPSCMGIVGTTEEKSYIYGSKRNLSTFVSLATEALMY